MACRECHTGGSRCRGTWRHADTSCSGRNAVHVSLLPHCSLNSRPRSPPNSTHPTTTQVPASGRELAAKSAELAAKDQLLGQAGQVIALLQQRLAAVEGGGGGGGTSVEQQARTIAGR